MRAREIKHAAKLLGLPAGLQKNGRIGPGAPACDSPPVLFDAGGAFYGAVRTLPTVLVLLLRGKFAVAFGEWVYVCAYAHLSLAVGAIVFDRFALLWPLLAQFDPQYSWRYSYAAWPAALLRIPVEGGVPLGRACGCTASARRGRPERCGGGFQTGSGQGAI